MPRCCGVGVRVTTATTWGAIAVLRPRQRDGRASDALVSSRATASASILMLLAAPPGAVLRVCVHKELRDRPLYCSAIWRDWSLRSVSGGYL